MRVGFDFDVGFVFLGLVTRRYIPGGLVRILHVSETIKSIGEERASIECHGTTQQKNSRRRAKKNFTDRVPIVCIAIIRHNLLPATHDPGAGAQAAELYAGTKRKQF